MEPGRCILSRGPYCATADRQYQRAKCTGGSWCSTTAFPKKQTAGCLVPAGDQEVGGGQRQLARDPWLQSFGFEFNIKASHWMQVALIVISTISLWKFFHGFHWWIFWPFLKPQPRFWCLRSGWISIVLFVSGWFATRQVWLMRCQNSSCCSLFRWKYSSFFNWWASYPNQPPNTCNF